MSSTICADVHHTMQLVATATEEGSSAGENVVHSKINIYSREVLSSEQSGDVLKHDGTSEIEPMCSLPVTTQHPFGVSMLQFIQGDECYRGGGVGPILLSSGRGDGGGLCLWRIIIHHSSNAQADDISDDLPNKVQLKLESTFKECIKGSVTAISTQVCGACSSAHDLMQTVFVAVAINQRYNGATGARNSESFGSRVSNGSAVDAIFRSSVYVYVADISTLDSDSDDTGLDWKLQGWFPIHAQSMGQGLHCEEVMSMCWIEDCTNFERSLMKRSPTLLVGSSSRCQAYVNHQQFNRWDIAPDILDIAVDPSNGCSSVAWAPGDIERSTAFDSMAVMAAIATGEEVLLVNIGLHIDEGRQRGQGGRIVARLKHGAQIEHIAWNIIGTALATSDSSGITRIWGPNLLSEWEEQQRVE